MRRAFLTRRNQRGAGVGTAGTAFPPGMGLTTLYGSKPSDQVQRVCVRRAGSLGAKSGGYVGSLDTNSTMVSAVEEPGELRDGGPLFGIAAVLVAVGHAAAHGDHRMVFKTEPKCSNGRGSIEPEAVGL